MATDYEPSLEFIQVYYKGEKIFLPYSHKSERYKARTDILEFAEERAGKSGNRIPVFTVFKDIPSSGEQRRVSKELETVM